ncbi:uncharacterized protein RCC_05335 [Ramularia collo-cygni]|uniref:Ricin B lectin domain-containing protein n=1 Tax=Ramularia collo-cygni TaxID=112498 RepID=A0A2D3VA19_9PEZI|nr:uncharacterized protein RCC_05335 [Ramularia collo-cygni]CZT19484.1 uncharacterized protein RCC_05335 [Ramularia collo-cygni]
MNNLFVQNHQASSDTGAMSADGNPPPQCAEDVVEDDGSTMTSDGAWGCYTPTTTASFPPLFISAIPWPEISYMILEKKSRKAMTLTSSGLLLQDPPTEGANASNTWLCVSKDNHTGFYNTSAKVYLGHDGKCSSQSVEHAVVGKMAEWECFIARQHPKGGYLLLSPFWSELWIVGVGEEGKIMRGRHENTVWDFEEV